VGGLMKTIKFKKKWYNRIDLIYTENGLVNEANRCNPSRVYINPADEKLIKRALTALFGKTKYRSKKMIETDVALHMLNLCPNTSLGVAKGYILVEESIDE
jgi:hypothetical protein